MHMLKIDTPAASSLPPRILTKHGVQQGMTLDKAREIIAGPRDLHDWLDLLNHASACYLLGYDESALALTLESTRLQPTASGYINLSVIHSMAGRFIDASTAAREAYSLEPSNRTAATIHCENLLRLGRWHEAWPLFPNYYDQSHVALFSLALPEWTGQDLHGKRVLVIEGGGYGDNFFFARYLPRLHDLGAKLTYFCPASMASLMALQPYIDNVIPTQQGEAAQLRIDNFDYYTPLLSLGGKFHQSPFEPGQPTPYITAPGRVRVDRLLRIGFCHQAAEAGNPRPFRSLNESQMESFHIAFSGCDVVHLVPGEGWLDTWLDTAQWMLSCDLIITVDTGVAHLSAAMGKPTWTLLPGFSAWYYLLGTTTHPLYPDMRLFRNHQRGLDHAVATCVSAFQEVHS